MNRKIPSATLLIQFNNTDNPSLCKEGLLLMLGGGVVFREDISVTLDGI